MGQGIEYFSPTRQLHNPHLLKHLQKIKTVPGLHHLPIPHPKHQHPLKRDRLAGGFHAKAHTRMRCLDFAIADDQVTF